MSREYVEFAVCQLLVRPVWVDPVYGEEGAVDPE